jgi:hypothetical protein
VKRRNSKRKRRGLGCGLSVIGLFVLVAGCHGRESKENDAPLKPGELANRGRAEIVEECGKQSYDLVSKGLIVSETGLHEDVFVLADHLEGLSDALVEADQRLKELDASAFTNATKEAEKQAEKKLRGPEKPEENEAQHPEPNDY